MGPGRNLPYLERILSPSGSSELPESSCATVPGNPTKRTLALGTNRSGEGGKEAVAIGSYEFAAGGDREEQNTGHSSRNVQSVDESFSLNSRDCQLHCLPTFIFSTSAYMGIKNSAERAVWNRNQTWGSRGTGKGEEKKTSCLYA